MKAEQTGRAFLAKLGVADLKAARALDSEVIQKAMAGMGMGTFWPVADGETLTGDSHELYQAGHFHDTPVLAGTNSDEGSMFARSGATPEAFERRIRNECGPAADVMLKAYPHATKAEALQSSKDIVRDSVFAWPTWAWADLQTGKGKNKAWVYYFDHRGGSGGGGGGSSHAAEIPFVFGNLGGILASASDENKKLSDLMRSYWVNFAKNGNPNGEGLPEWPAYAANDVKAMIFDKDPSARPLPNLEQIKAFDAFYRWRREEAKAKPAN